MRPARMRRIVDLPQPDGPSRAMISLGRMARLMSCSTVSGWPLGCGNSCVMPRASHRAVEEAAAMTRLLLAQRILRFGQAVQAVPDNSVEADHHHRHDQ